MCLDFSSYTPVWRRLSAVNYRPVFYRFLSWVLPAFFSQRCWFQTLRCHQQSCVISVVVCSVQLQQPGAMSPTFSTFSTFSSPRIYFPPHEPTVKRARAHTDAVLSASRVFKLFIFSSIAFTELCSNSCRVIYYKSFIVNRVVFSKLSLFLVSPSPVCPVRLSRAVCGHRTDALGTLVLTTRVNNISRPVVEVF